jgi:DNA-binding CsgD family transcriptional regulator
MPRLSRAQDHARRRIDALATSSGSTNRIATDLMTILEEAIGWDGYRLFGLDRSTLLVNRLLAASENDAAARLEWLREVYLAIPTQYAELPELARRGLRGVAFQERQEQCWGYPAVHLARIDPQDHYRHYHEFRSPVGGTLLGILRHGGVPLAALQAYRRDPRRQFRASDVAFLQLVSERAGVALAAAMARDLAVAPRPEATAASGILMVGARGEIQQATPAGSRWLEVMPDRDDGLPTSIWATIAARRHGGALAAASVIVETAAGPVRVEASDGGMTGVTAIILSAVQPPAPPEIPVSWGLTPQERAVVAQLATGKGNAQIAAALFVGEHTVEWHLRSVFDKLNVRSRQEVLAALFHHTLLPGIEREVIAQAS